MSYIKNNLQKNETIVSNVELHWWYWFGVVLNFLFIITIPFGIFHLLRGLTLEQALTNKRLIVRTGIISRKVDEIKLSKVEAVELRQGIFGRMFGFGKIKVTGAGIHNTVSTYLTPNPVKIKNLIDEAID